MRRLLASLLLISLLAVPQGAREQGFTFPPNPTVDEVVEGPGGQQFKWDGTKWVAMFGTAGNFAPLTNPSGGQNNYAPIAAPNFTGTVSIGGTPLAAIYAPLVNITGGANNYAPIASPNFTGVAVLPNGSYTNGTFAVSQLNVSGGGTWAASGLNVSSGGVNVTAPTGLSVVLAQNAQTPVVITNTSTAANAVAILRLNNSVNSSWVMHTSTGYTGSGPNVPPDALQVASNGTNGIIMATNAAIAPGPPITFWTGGIEAAQFYNGVLDIFTPPTGGYASPVWGPSLTDLQGSMAVSTGNFVMASGGHQNESNQWVADADTAVMENLSGQSGNVAFYETDQLTKGEEFTPNISASFTLQSPNGGVNLGLRSPSNINTGNSGNGLFNYPIYFQPSVTGQCGGTCSVISNDGLATRVGNVATVSVTFNAADCNDMCGYLQFQGFPWQASNQPGATAYCAVDYGTIPLSPGYTQLNCRLLPGWAGCLPVEMGSSVPASYYYSNWVPQGQWAFNFTCSYMIDW